MNEEFKAIILNVGKNINHNFFIPEYQLDFFKKLPDLFQDKKGFIIIGEYGCGKTLCMKICQSLFRYGKFISTRHLMREFQISGDGVLDIYGRNSFTFNDHGYIDKTKPINFCFDDLGINDAIKNRYGNNINVMAEIILDRYENFINYGMKTFFTTNKTPDELEKLYGDRVRDRLKEMCNAILMPGKSLRK